MKRTFGMLSNYSLLVFVLVLAFKSHALVLSGHETIAVNSFESCSVPPIEGLIKNEPGQDWYKLTIDDRSKEVWVLEFIDFRIDHIDIYIPIPDSNLFKRYTTGDAYRFMSRPIIHKNLVFNLPQKPTKPYTIYFKIIKKGHSAFVLNANLRTVNNFAEYGFAEYAFLSFFYGILFCMMLYNFFHYVFTKDRLHLLYVVYVSSLSLFSLSRIDGLGFEYIWPKVPILNSFLFSLSLGLYVAATIGFSAYFLSLKASHARIYRLLMAYALLRIFYALTPLWGLSLYDLKLLDLTLFLFIFWLGTKQKFLSTAPSRFFLAGFASMILGFAIYTLQDLAWISQSFWIYYALNFGVLAESILLSMALSEKTKSIILTKQAAQKESIVQLEANKALQTQLILELQEKEALKDKVNQELAQKVRERTQELEEKNQILNEQKEKIEKLASQIDIQYYSLKKETYQKELKYVWNKHLSYEEFLKLYPTEFTCLKYLENEKWPAEYKCIKCGNEQYTKNPTSLARKCNRCSHIDSVTANTLYHGIHFPLQKAMYIVHCVIHGAEGLNVSSLSRDIDLRLNTTRGFIAKVEKIVR